MRKFEFVLEMRRLGFTDHFIGQVLALRDRERAAGVKRPYRDYMPESKKKSGLPVG